MERLPLRLAITVLALLASGCGNNDAPAADGYQHCQKTALLDERVCFADGFLLSTLPHQYCGMTVSTFGYVSIDWSGVVFYPDESRAKHDFIYSSIRVLDEFANSAIEQELARRSGDGFYASITAKFSCSVSSDAGRDARAGSFEAIRMASVVDINEDAVSRKERMIVGGEDR